MNKSLAISRLLNAVREEPAVFTTGYACRIAAAVADRPGNFYMVGSMGLAACIGAGVALASGLPTVVVDGDGSLLMNPGALIAVAGGTVQLPLLHVVLDDSAYASTGGQPTSSPRVDFPGLARAAGYAQVHAVRDAAALDDTLASALRDLREPVFVHCLLQGADDAVPPRIELSLPEMHARFAAHVAQQAGLAGHRSPH